MTIHDIPCGNQDSPRDGLTGSGTIDFKKYQTLFNEIEARDTVFRLKFTHRERRVKQPFQFRLFDDDSTDILKRLDKGDISKKQALTEFTILMENYYGRKHQ